MAGRFEQNPHQDAEHERDEVSKKYPPHVFQHDLVHHVWVFHHDGIERRRIDWGHQIEAQPLNNDGEKGISQCELPQKAFRPAGFLKMPHGISKREFQSVHQLAHPLIEYVCLQCVVDTPAWVVPRGQRCWPACHVHQ